MAKASQRLAGRGSISPNTNGLMRSVDIQRKAWTTVLGWKKVEMKAEYMAINIYCKNDLLTGLTSYSNYFP
jgi:hypothetical protein